MIYFKYIVISLNTRLAVHNAQTSSGVESDEEDGDGHDQDRVDVHEAKEYKRNNLARFEQEQVLKRISPFPARWFGQEFCRLLGDLSVRLVDLGVFVFVLQVVFSRSGLYAAEKVEHTNTRFTSIT